MFSFFRNISISILHIYSLKLVGQSHVWRIIFERTLEQKKEGIKGNIIPQWKWNHQMDDFVLEQYYNGGTLSHTVFVYSIEKSRSLSCQLCPTNDTIISLSISFLYLHQFKYQNRHFFAKSSKRIHTWIKEKNRALQQIERARIYSREQINQQVVIKEWQAQKIVGIS